jgi:hypothetical protein
VRTIRSSAAVDLVLAWTSVQPIVAGVAEERIVTG